MLFGSENISTYTRGNMMLWLALAFQAGMINIAGFLSCHGFVSNVTGYATLFGLEAGQEHFSIASAFLLVPIFYLIGAGLSGVLVDSRIRAGQKPRYFVVFGCLFLIMLYICVAGFNGMFGSFGVPDEASANFYLLTSLSMACGMQNGTVTLVSKSVVRTTHLTGLTTDLGIGLVRVWNARRRHEKLDQEGEANLMRIGIILSFTLGSCIGFFLFAHWKFRAFAVPTAVYGILFFLMIYFQILRARLVKHA